MTQRNKFWIITALFLVILLLIGLYVVFLNQQKDIEYKFISISKVDKNHYYVVFMDTEGALKLIRTNDSLYSLNISVSNISNVVIWHHNNKCTNYWCGSYDVYITNYSLLKR